MNYLCPVVLEKGDSDYLLWSTRDQDLVAEAEDRVRIPTTTWTEHDWNRDHR